MDLASRHCQCLVRVRRWIHSCALDSNGFDSDGLGSDDGRCTCHLRSTACLLLLTSYLLTYLLTHLLAYLLNYLLTYLPTYLLTYLLTQPQEPVSPGLPSASSVPHSQPSFSPFTPPPANDLPTRSRYSNRIAFTWQSHSNHIAITWQSHSNHIAII